MGERERELVRDSDYFNGRTTKAGGILFLYSYSVEQVSNERQTAREKIYKIQRNQKLKTVLLLDPLADYLMKPTSLCSFRFSTLSSSSTFSALSDADL